ncbi:glutathione-regulated potassium-efflux system oxidoreductase KefF [Paracraurococcus ruber]|uniref:NAD(P)H oxidoreductase n=1 Tax=Paracraurococcus ruber TaxID=77675 RepID=A0ABS1D290_9PROT|nr:NAD(P)H-dependent oxidoreductase [Paracraurococcus ruber]MBK1660942.1 NAD(P)H oxidoreductase [Paracraurococcus ruber]TDG26714.1 NAD(P)H oxidoreductase [Paracraurococcus ruber]
MPQRILLILAHPAQRRSRVNAALRAAAAELEGTTLHDLYEAYPDFMIDVDREQALLLEHDTVVFQHPLYWYSCPAILKEWLDLVLEHGFAYGRAGTKLSGKGWMTAISTGGTGHAYSPDGLNRHSIHDFLRPFEATARLCHMRWHPPFVVHGTHLLDGAALARQGAAYRQRLLALRDEPELAAAPGHR